MVMDKAAVTPRMEFDWERETEPRDEENRRASLRMLAQRLIPDPQYRERFLHRQGVPPLDE